VRLLNFCVVYQERDEPSPHGRAPCRITDWSPVIPVEMGPTGRC
jgi:hypothetical protein